MALLLGIYHEFIFSIAALNGGSFALLRQRRITAFWTRINGSFLVTLTCGITTGLLLLRALFSNLVNDYPIFVSSFFFSLVIIAALLLLRKITRWNVAVVICIVAGLLFSYFITRWPPFTTPQHAGYGFLAGILAGSTFVVPGVSGAFILMFIGKYQYILTSFGSLEFAVIILFIAGAMLGLLFVARFMARLLADYHNATVGLFAGLMIGSLNKIWPWREVFEYATTLQGQRIPAFDKSILPWRYLEITGKDPQVFHAILMMASGVFMVVIIEKVAARLKTKS